MMNRRVIALASKTRLRNRLNPPLRVGAPAIEKLANGSFEAMNRRNAATPRHRSGAKPVLSFLDRPGDAVGSFATP